MRGRKTCALPEKKESVGTKNSRQNNRAIKQGINLLIVPRIVLSAGLDVNTMISKRAIRVRRLAEDGMEIILFIVLRIGQLGKV